MAQVPNKEPEISDDVWRGQFIAWFCVAFVILMIWMQVGAVVYTWDEGGPDMRDAIAVTMIVGGALAGWYGAKFAEWMMYGRTK